MVMLRGDEDEDVVEEDVEDDKVEEEEDGEG